MSKDVKKGVSRRSFLTTSAGAVATGAALIGGGGIVKSIIKPKVAGAAITASYPYLPLYEENLPALAELGRVNMGLGGGCGLNGGKTLVQAIIDSGADVDGNWANFPIDMLAYGGGGVSSWGTICGALNGTLAIVCLICKANGYDFGAVSNALMQWYSETTLPTVENFPTYDIDNGVIRTVSDSPLCHVSISNFLSENDGTLAIKGARCSRVVGDTVAKAAELLNLCYYGNVADIPPFVPNETTAHCLSCHAGVDTVGKMDCNSCHPGYNHNPAKSGK